ncbi:MAG: hypothetical protein ACOCZ5_00395 [bacterium]
MSTYRSYFKKNSTLIKDNVSNNSQNPVTEISYGTFDKLPSRFIFDVDLNGLLNKIEQGFINPNRIVKHVLHMTNTIRYAPQYIGTKSYSQNINRASSFELDLFKLTEEWDEGSGYVFEYDDAELPVFPYLKYQAVNWFDRKTDTPWNTEGAYLTGSTEIIGSQRFEKGNENLEIDVTDYINQRISGSTGFTGSTGLGIKFADIYESLETEFRQAVAFHARKTNTFYEPYIETIIDDTVQDDRNYFYLDKDNDLYLYSSIGGMPQNITIDYVNIYDYEDNLIDVISGDSVENVGKGVYKISYSVDSNNYPDAVLFRDEWITTINGKEKIFDGEFYLISGDNYYAFNNSNLINFDNYFFYFWGIKQAEKLRAGNIRKVRLTIKELYPNQDKFLPLDIEYRIFTTLGEKYEIDVIPFTKINRTNTGYEFDIDTSWLIPQDYKIQIRLKNGDYYENKQTLSFTVVSDGNVFQQ